MKMRLGREGISICSGVIRVQKGIIKRNALLESFRMCRKMGAAIIVGFFDLLIKDINFDWNKFIWKLKLILC